VPPRLQTKGGKLSDLARHVVLPTGVVSTGWPAVRDTCLSFGVEFDPWQDGAGRAILSKRADGIYATTVGGVVISIPRQVGKTFLIGAIVFALCMIFPGLTVIWTAHHTHTANETFGNMQAYAKRKKVAPHIKQVWRGSGDECIEFHNGSKIMFGARERGFGRGLAQVDVLVLDESQILTENAVDNLVPTTNQSPNPLVLYMGTPPKPADPSEVFTRKRTDALTGESDDTVYIEFSADRGSDPKDRKAWSKANPSYPRRTNEASMLRMLKNLSEDSFVREGLGIWDEDADLWVIPSGDWIAAADAGALIPDDAPLSYGLECHDQYEWSTIGVAGPSPKGVQVEIAANEPGTSWVAGWAKERGVTIVVRKGSPAAALIDDLTTAGVTVEEVTAEAAARACGQFYRAAIERRLVHRDEGVLTKSVRKAVRKNHSDGFLWDQRRSNADIAPLWAVTLAASKHLQPVVSTESVYETRGPVEL
jgi:phage terminase large subunit-like protein